MDWGQRCCAADYVTALQVLNKLHGTFGQRDRKLLMGIAAQASLALARACNEFEAVISQIDAFESLVTQEIPQ